MLLSTQHHGCSTSARALSSHSITHHDSAKLFNSVLTPPTIADPVQVTFTSANMLWTFRNPFDQTSGLPTPCEQKHQAVPEDQARSPGLQSEHKEEEDCGSHPRAISSDRHSKAMSRQLQTRSPEDELDVFEVQRLANSTPSSGISDKLAEQYDPMDLSLANKKPSLPSPALTATPPQAVDIKKSKRIQSPLLSPQRDPRQLFGSQDTHLPWVRRLSSNRFTMNISPNMLPYGSPPAKSVWDAEDAEFDRWPTPIQAREELDTVRRNATLKRSTFVKTENPKLSIAEQITDAMDTPMGDETRTKAEQEQTILELEDMDCGNPWGRDLHDIVVSPFRSRSYKTMPANAPSRHMHVLDAKAYTTSEDPVVKAARPRLCDAVATILAYTSPECLEAFLNPEVEVFEWRRLGNCVMIRRERNEVVVGNYYNFGTTYEWGFLVRSAIDADGAWSEKWASVSQGTTPVGTGRVLFEHFEAESTNSEIQPDSEEFALFVGRQLADFLLRWEVWNYNKWWRYKVEWEADGKVTNARDKYRYPAGLTFD